MRSDESQLRIFWRIKSQIIECTGRIKTRHNRNRKPEKCRMGTRMEQSFFGSSHWSDSRGRGWEVSFERKTFRKSGFGFGESTKCAAGSERTSQYNQYKSEEERERRARQKEESPLDGVFWGRVFVVVRPLEKTADEYSSLFCALMNCMPSLCLYFCSFCRTRNSCLSQCLLPRVPHGGNRSSLPHKKTEAADGRLRSEKPYDHCRKAVFFAS